MEVPCVRVPRDEGETTRQRLAATDAIDRDYRIDAGDEWVYIPIADDAAVPDDLTIVSRELQPRQRQTLPRDLIDGEISYERLGEIALIDEDDPERAREVADALLGSSLPFRTVLNRASEIAGECRVREWEVIAGEDTETLHREFGAEFRVDVTEAYFSPRLATERHRVVSQVDPDEKLVDMFAGVGPFSIPMAMRGATVLAVDLNPRAIEYLEANVVRNGVADRVTIAEGDVREIAPEYAGWADRLVMNLPHRADEFLDAARIMASDRCRLHYYDIQPDSEPFRAGERAIEAAFADDYEITVVDRREVRSYAPHEVNVCLDVDLRRA